MTENIEDQKHQSTNVSNQSVSKIIYFKTSYPNNIEIIDVKNISKPPNVHMISPNSLTTLVHVMNFDEYPQDFNYTTLASSVMKEYEDMHACTQTTLDHCEGYNTKNYKFNNRLSRHMLSKEDNSKMVTSSCAILKNKNKYNTTFPKIEELRAMFCDQSEGIHNTSCHNTCFKQQPNKKPSENQWTEDPPGNLNEGVYFSDNDTQYVDENTDEEDGSDINDCRSLYSQNYSENYYVSSRMRGSTNSTQRHVNTEPGTTNTEESYYYKVKDVSNEDENKKYFVIEENGDYPNICCREDYSENNKFLELRSETDLDETSQEYQDLIEGCKYSNNISNKDSLSIREMKLNMDKRNKVNLNDIEMNKHMNNFNVNETKYQNRLEDKRNNNLQCQGFNDDEVDKYSLERNRFESDETYLVRSKTYCSGNISQCNFDFTKNNYYDDCKRNAKNDLETANFSKSKDISDNAKYRYNTSNPQNYKNCARYHNIYQTNLDNLKKQNLLPTTACKTNKSDHGDDFKNHSILGSNSLEGTKVSKPVNTHEINKFSAERGIEIFKPTFLASDGSVEYIYWNNSDLSNSSEMFDKQLCSVPSIEYTNNIGRTVPLLLKHKIKKENGVNSESSANQKLSDVDGSCLNIGRLHKSDHETDMFMNGTEMTLINGSEVPRRQIKCDKYDRFKLIADKKLIGAANYWKTHPKPDCVVIIGDTKMQCHKKVLDAFSPYFEQMNDTVIELPEYFVPPSAFYIIYSWMIGTLKGAVSFGLRKETVHIILRAVEHLGIETFKEKCLKFIQNKEYLNNIYSTF